MQICVCHTILLVGLVVVFLEGRRYSHSSKQFAQQRRSKQPLAGRLHCAGLSTVVLEQRRYSHSDSLHADAATRWPHWPVWRQCIWKPATTDGPDMADESLSRCCASYPIKSAAIPQASWRV